MSGWPDIPKAWHADMDRAQDDAAFEEYIRVRNCAHAGLVTYPGGRYECPDCGGKNWPTRTRKETP